MATSLLNQGQHETKSAAYSEYTDESGSEYTDATASDSEDSEMVREREAKEAAAAEAAAKAKKNQPKPLTKVQTMFKRGALLGAALFLAEYLAVSLVCVGFAWPASFFSCPSAGPRCGSSEECVAITSFDAAVCFNGRCSSGLDMHPVCYSSCTPMSMKTTLDVTIGNIFLVCLWFGGELVIQKFDRQLGAELSAGRRWVAKVNKRKGFDHDQILKDCHHTWQWNDELNGWIERTKKQSGLFGANLAYRAYGLYFMFFCLSLTNMWLIIKAIAPQQYVIPPYSLGSFAEVGYLLAQFGHIKDGGFYEYIILLQFSLEFGLFMCCAAAVRWPRPALVRSGNLKFSVNVNFEKRETEAVRLADEHNGLIQDTCLLIACHESCLTKAAKATFTNTLEVACKLFPINAIFVCDNGRPLNPVDRTEEVCDRLSLKYDKTGKRKLQYLYIPEGNKSHAMYWTTEYWIPELVRRGESIDFQYAIMIDDDVPLPPDLHVPLHTLARNMEIKAVSYVIMAASEDGSENDLVNLQDAEYKLAGFVKQFQWQYGSTTCCHGAIGLWRRDVLGKRILWDHDTMFHGEDLYMGLLLHRMRKNYTIMVSAGAVVPTFAPSHLVMLFRQRTTSWDLCAHRKWMTYVKEFCCGWCNTRTLILKPFLLQEIINVIIDYVRLYLMIGLGNRNFPNLLVVFVVFYALLYIEITIFNQVVLRDRPDLRMTLKTVIMFPFYRTFELLFRLHALLKNIIEYATWRRKNIKISEREAHIHDLPPVPPVKRPNWWTIWHANKDDRDDSRFKKLTENVVRDLAVEDMMKTRIKPLASAYLMWQKLRLENFDVGFPDMLASHGDAQGSKDLSNAMQQLQDIFEQKLSEMIPDHQWGMFEERIDTLLTRWNNNANAVLFANKAAFQNPNVNQSLYTVRSNRHVLDSNIRALVYYTRWPASNDPVADLKAAVESLLRMLEKQIDRLENPERYRDLEAERGLTNVVEALEWVKEVVDKQQYDDIENARLELQGVEQQIPNLGLAQQHVNNIMTVVLRNREQLEVMAARTSGGLVAATPITPA